MNERTDSSPDRGLHIELAKALRTRPSPDALAAEMARRGSVDEDFATWAIFYGPAGGERTIS